jgi:hypothetical protein
MNAGAGTVKILYFLLVFFHQDEIQRRKNGFNSLLERKRVGESLFHRGKQSFTETDGASKFVCRTRVGNVLLTGRRVVLQYESIIYQPLFLVYDQPFLYS